MHLKVFVRPVQFHPWGRERQSRLCFARLECQLRPTEGRESSAWRLLTFCLTPDYPDSVILGRRCDSCPTQRSTNLGSVCAIETHPLPSAVPVVLLLLPMGLWQSGGTASASQSIFTAFVRVTLYAFTRVSDLAPMPPQVGRSEGQRVTPPTALAGSGRPHRELR